MESSDYPECKMPLDDALRRRRDGDEPDIPLPTHMPMDDGLGTGGGAPDEDRSSEIVPQMPEDDPLGSGSSK